MTQLLAPDLYWKAERSHGNIGKVGNASPHLAGWFLAFRYPDVESLHTKILQKGTRGCIIRPICLGKLRMDDVPASRNARDEREFGRSRDYISELYIVGAGKLSHGIVEERLT